MKNARLPPFERAEGNARHFPAFRRPCFSSHNIELFGLLLWAALLTCQDPALLAKIPASLHYCITCQDPYVQQSQAAKHPLPQLEVKPLKNWLPCYCYAIKANSRTIISQVPQPASAGEWAGISQSRRHGGTLVSLAPQTKLQAPQIETWNTINKWSFG